MLHMIEEVFAFYPLEKQSSTTENCNDAIQSQGWGELSPLVQSGGNPYPHASPDLKCNQDYGVRMI